MNEPFTLLHLLHGLLLEYGLFLVTLALDLLGLPQDELLSVLLNLCTFLLVQATSNVTARLEDCLVCHHPIEGGVITSNGGMSNFSYEEPQEVVLMLRQGSNVAIVLPDAIATCVAGDIS